MLRQFRIQDSAEDGEQKLVRSHPMVLKVSVSPKSSESSVNIVVETKVCFYALNLGSIKKEALLHRLEGEAKHMLVNWAEDEQITYAMRHGLCSLNLQRCCQQYTVVWLAATAFTASESTSLPEE